MDQLEIKAESKILECNDCPIAERERMIDLLPYCPLCRVRRDPVTGACLSKLNYQETRSSLLLNTNGVDLNGDRRD